MPTNIVGSNGVIYNLQGLNSPPVAGVPSPVVLQTVFEEFMGETPLIFLSLQAANFNDSVLQEPAVTFFAPSQSVSGDFV